MEKDSECCQLEEKQGHTGVKKESNIPQMQSDKIMNPEELATLKLEIENIVDDKKETSAGNLIKGDITDIKLDKESEEISFIVEFEGNKGKFTLDILDEETGLKSDRIKSLESKVGAKIENISKFIDQPLYMVRKQNGHLYGFIPNKMHKLTERVFGDYCAPKSSSSDIFNGGFYFIIILSLVFIPVTRGIVIVIDALSISSFALILCFHLIVCMIVALSTGHTTASDSVYKISDTN
jgi:hypothetical protein